jgi:hypothetical protein
MVLRDALTNSHLKRQAIDRHELNFVDLLQIVELHAIVIIQ